jgi:hypothetical protein
LSTNQLTIHWYIPVANAVDESHDNAMSAPEKAVIEGEAEAEAEAEVDADAVSEGIYPMPPIAAPRSNIIISSIAIINLTIILPDPEAERMQIMVGVETSIRPIAHFLLMQLIGIDPRASPRDSAIHHRLASSIPVYMLPP